MTASTSIAVDAQACRPTRLAVSLERLERMWAMTATQRLQAARAGQLSLGEMQRWAACCPAEVPLVDGEFFFIAALLADNEPADDRLAQ